MKILCAEALWDNDITDNRQTYKTLLNLVKNETGCKVAYFTFNTSEELDYLFEIFKKKDYDIFYLSSHMQDGKALSGLHKKLGIDYVELVHKHRHGLKHKILHLAGCSSLSTENVNPRELLDVSGLSILSGYAIDTDTTQSSAMELLYLVGIINEGGVEEFLYNLEHSYAGLAKETGFVIYRS
jgi:hypothetical protein